MKSNGSKKKLSQTEARIEAIQTALRKDRLSGWLFYSFRGSDPLAPRILAMTGEQFETRRWFYFVPAKGEPTKLVHSIERQRLDCLPGKKVIYLAWKQLHRSLKEILSGQKRVAMQYSPNNAIPYISRVDAGTIELVRGLGATIVSSANLVSQFEAVWTREQEEANGYSAKMMHQVVHETFAEIARRIRARLPTTEFDIQQFMLRLYEGHGLETADPPIVAVNANSAIPHYGPTKERCSPISEGDFVLIDLWAKKKVPNATYTDITWTGFVGTEVPREHAEIFSIVRRGRDAAVAFVKKSVSAGKTIYGWQVDDVCRAVIEKAGYGLYFIHRTGHSIGEEVHGNGTNIDNLETKDERRILPRTSFSIEPGIYLEGKFGVRSELDMYVTEKRAIVTGPGPQKAVIPILKDY